MAFSTKEIADWLEAKPRTDREVLSAMQINKVTPEQMMAATNQTRAQIDSKISGVIDNVYNQQFGRNANKAEITDGFDFLNAGNLVDKGAGNLNSTQEGYNYDTNDLVAAYRETFGRNPTQDEYVKAMATLGIENFDRASLGASGNYKAATVAALESDPLAGRYAGYNPYAVGKDAVNVSTNVLGDKVQYTSPVTQRPVVASFNDGKLQLNKGVDVLTPKQIESAVGLAVGTGALTDADYRLMNKNLGSAKTIDDVYGAFASPKAVASLGANGQQTGVGRTYDEAVNRGFGNVDMDALYKGIYPGAAPSTTANVMTTDALRTVQPTDKTNFLKSTQLGVQKGLDLQSSLQAPTTYNNLGVFGAANGKKMGAGYNNYQSDLIESLRAADNGLVSNNTGVTKYGEAPPTGTGNVTLNSGGAFDPKKLTQDAASAADVEAWNQYNTSRTNALTARTPVLSFTEWQAANKPGEDGKPKTAAAVAPVVLDNPTWVGF
jgi:hypothetical protein